MARSTPRFLSAGPQGGASHCISFRLSLAIAYSTSFDDGSKVTHTKKYCIYLIRHPLQKKVLHLMRIETRERLKSLHVSSSTFIFWRKTLVCVVCRSGSSRRVITN